MRFVKAVSIILAVLVIIAAGGYYLYAVAYPLHYREIIEEYAQEYDVDEYLLMAMINTESGFNKKAVSSAGAVGLMQLTPPTAEWVAAKMGGGAFDTDMLYDPETNIKMGTWYISILSEDFPHLELALAAYNAGRGNVSKWLQNGVISEDGTDYKNIPFEETRNYITSVLKKAKMYELLYQVVLR